MKTSETVPCYLNLSNEVKGVISAAVLGWGIEGVVLNIDVVEIKGIR